MTNRKEKRDGAIGLHQRSKSKSKEAAPKTARAIILTVALLLCAATYWASITEVQELARAEGELKPTGELLRIEHSSGGRIADLRIKPGQSVNEGEIIAVLSSREIDASLSQLATKISKMQGDIARLHSMLDDLPSDPEASSSAQNATLRALTNAQRSTFMARRGAQAARVRQRAATVRLSRSSRDNMAQRVAVSERQWATYGTLLERGLVSRTEMAKHQLELEALRGDLISAESNLQAAVSEHQDEQSALEELSLSTREENLVELSELTAEFDVLISERDAKRAERALLELRAPADGVVQSLHSTSEGELVRPGGILAELLPTGERLVAEIKLSPKDIGHVVEGDNVSVKITSFDQRRYGAIPGIVSRISPTTEAENPNAEPHFEVVVELATQSIGRGNLERQIRSGMVVNAEILTSRRTVMEYLLKPIERSLAVAMSER